MKISEIKPNQGKIELQGVIIDISPVREFSNGRVANAKLKDDEGEEITLVLWNEQIDRVKIGDKIRIENGYAKEWNNQLQVSTGKFGTLILIKDNNETNEEKNENKEIEGKVEESKELTETIQKENIKEIVKESTDGLQQKKSEEIDEEDIDFNDLVDIEEDNL